MASVECTDDVPTPDDIRPQIDEPLGNPEMSSLVDSSSTKSQLSADLDITDMYVALENVVPETRNIDQLTPHNQKCCTIYQKDFLMALKDSPLSRVRPANIPAAVLAVDRRLQINETPHKRSWGKDSATLKSQSQVDLNTADIYAALENIEPVPGNICLKNSKWNPRRQDHTLKTIDQIQKEADREQLNIQMMPSAPMPSRRDDRVGNMGGSQNTLDRKGGRYSRNNASDSDGWIASNSRNRPSPFTVQSDKLKSKAPLIDEPLGNPQMFGLWGQGQVGSSVKSQPQIGLKTTNMYMAVENIEPERRNFGGKDSYSSSSSQSITQVRKLMATTVPKQSTASIVSPEEKMEITAGNCLNEYLCDNCSVNGFYLAIRSISRLFYPRIVSLCYMHVLEKSQYTRLKTGVLFGKLVKQEKLSVDEYCLGLEEILSLGECLVTDVPKIWDYIAEILVGLICDEALPLDRLKQSFNNTLTQKNAAKILVPLFKLVVEENGDSFLQGIWKKSGVQLAEFIDISEINKLIADYITERRSSSSSCYVQKMESVVGGGARLEQHLSYSHIEAKLLELFKCKSDLDTVVQWITTNVGNNIKNNKFIKTLATAIFLDSIDSNYKLVNDRLREHRKLLMIYVDYQQEYELQCLHAAQAVINKLGCPYGGLILSIFTTLNELGMISKDSFIAWEICMDPDEKEGKLASIFLLTRFLEQFKNEYDDYDQSDYAIW